MLFALLGHAQSIKTYLISNGGQSAMTPQGGIYASVGEPMSTEITNGEVMIAQGFLQVTLSEKLVPTKEILTEKLSVYPNPTSAQFTIELPDKEGDYKFQLFDNLGTLINEGMIEDTRETIDMQNLNSGSYFMHVIKNDAFIRTLKIVKN